MSTRIFIGMCLAVCAALLAALLYPDYGTCGEPAHPCLTGLARFGFAGLIDVYILPNALILAVLFLLVCLAPLKWVRRALTWTPEAPAVILVAGALAVTYPLVSLDTLAAALIVGIMTGLLDTIGLAIGVGLYNRLRRAGLIRDLNRIPTPTLARWQTP